MKPLDPRLMRYARSTRGFIGLAVVLGVITAVLVIAQARLLSDVIVSVTSEGAGWSDVRDAVVAVAALLAERWPLPWVPALALAGAAVAFAASAALAFRGRLAPMAGATGAGFALLFVLFVPGVNPPALPPEAVPAAAGRALWVYDTTPGLFTLAAGRPVRRAWNPAEAEQALRAGGALIASDGQLARLTPMVRERLVNLAHWRRIPGYLPEEKAWRSWRDRDPEAVYEGMSIVALHDGKDAPPGEAPR